MTHDEPEPRHRSLAVVRGGRDETADRVRAWLADHGVPHEDVLWVSDVEEDPHVISRSSVRRLLGGSYDVVVLDFIDDVEPETLGRCHGFVWGGGVLVLRLPPVGKGEETRRRLSVFPYASEDIGVRFPKRFDATLRRHQTCAELPVPAAVHDVTGTAEQRRVVTRLIAHAARSGGAAVLVAARGRGKSAALGLALRQARERNPQLRVAVTAAHPHAIGELAAFAGGDETLWKSPRDVERADDGFDLVVVDEAAQLSVPQLRRLADAHPRASFVFATTTHGYEGTGRGFTIRFVQWLARRRDVTRLTMEEPIRWCADDPVERFVYDALLLDAEPVDRPPSSALDSAVAVELDRDALVRDERLLRQLFGLLVQAHYRTAPGDLERMLDAPNVRVHAVIGKDTVLGANLVAFEGALPDHVVEELRSGQRRIRGHALPESFIAHLGHPEAGSMSMVRSVRIASHPRARRRGVATLLTEHLHDSYDADLFGTVFGATAEVIRFRQTLGYVVVRLGASRGARSGEPSVMMVRPVTERAARLVQTVRAELARDLPMQLRLLEADEQIPPGDDVRRALEESLPAPAALTEDGVANAVESYVEGPRTLESVCVSLRTFLEEHPSELARLEPNARALLTARLLDERSWQTASERGGFPSIPAAMRAARRAMREVYQRVVRMG